MKATATISCRSLTCCELNSRSTVAAGSPVLTMPSATGSDTKAKTTGVSTPASLRITYAARVSLILNLSDINMPGMSGLELLLRAKALRPDVRVIMITAYGDAETKRKALENGAEALLTSPIDFGMLRSEIDMRVERAA